MHCARAKWLHWRDRPAPPPRPCRRVPHANGTAGQGLGKHPPAADPSNHPGRRFEPVYNCTALSPTARTRCGLGCACVFVLPGKRACAPDGCASNATGQALQPTKLWVPALKQHQHTCKAFQGSGTRRVHGDLRGDNAVREAARLTPTRLSDFKQHLLPATVPSAMRCRTSMSQSQHVWAWVLIKGRFGLLPVLVGCAGQCRHAASSGNRSAPLAAAQAHVRGKGDQVHDQQVAGQDDHRQPDGLEQVEVG